MGFPRETRRRRSCRLLLIWWHFTFPPPLRTGPAWVRHRAGHWGGGQSERPSAASGPPAAGRSAGRRRAPSPASSGGWCPGGSAAPLHEPMPTFASSLGPLENPGAAPGAGACCSEGFQCPASTAWAPSSPPTGFKKEQGEEGTGKSQGEVRLAGVGCTAAFR